MSFTFEQPLMFALIIPVIIGGLFLLREGARRPIIISRMIVLSLLIIALASPSAIVSDVTSDENPNLVVIADDTASMKLFEENVGMNVYESLTAKTPTTFISLTGESTSLGDAVEQYSTGDNQIVLVSDGNSNYGKDLEEALQYAEKMGTTVYSVQPDLERNDLSVQIIGDKTVVIGNEVQYEILVSQAGNEEMEYIYKLYVDGVKKDNNENAVRPEIGRTNTIYPNEIKFDKLGTHELKVEITPLSDDYDPINNVYYKSIYVVPKPKVQLITDDTSAPLADGLMNLYSVSRVKTFTELDNKKAIVIDNQRVSKLSNEDILAIKNFILDGNGLVVVGGERSFDNGNYLNSSFEDLLPVVSKSTDWKGSKSIVIIMDMSFSVEQAQNIPHVKGNAISILNDPELRSANVGIVAYGSEGYDVSGGPIFLGNPNSIQTLETKIRNHQLTLTSDTSLESGLEIAKEWLNEEGGDMEIIILSDGGMGNSYDKALEIATEMHEDGIEFYYYHLKPSAAQGNTVYDYDTDEIYAERLMSKVDGHYEQIKNEQRITLSEGTNLENPDDEQDETPQLTSFPLIEYNTNHFITKNIEIEGNITGYNDATPKAGADRIIITSTGIPVVTTWRYGLGRVAAITTDNGNGGQATWASEIYKKDTNNSKLISSTMNWAIGNPQIEEGTVVEAEDTWFGTPATLYITHYNGNVPKLKYAGDTLTLAVTGQNTYQTTVDPRSIGFHDVSGYPIAVNYAAEYRDVGINPRLPSLIKANGGKSYSENEALANLLSDARGNSLKSIQKLESQKLYFLIAALLIFLGEIAVRRIREIQESKREA